MVTTNLKKKNEEIRDWYFISFRDVNKNMNIGCCNIRVRGGPKRALERTIELGINPGGEAAIFLIGKPELEPNRLYSRDEMINLNYQKINE